MSTSGGVPKQSSSPGDLSRDRRLEPASSGTAPKQNSAAGDLIRDRRLDDGVLPCGKAKCGVLVYVYEDSETRPPLNDISTTVKKTGGGGPGGKPTKSGRADYRGLEPGEYSVTATLSGDKLKAYAWPSTDDAGLTQTSVVPELVLKAFSFPAVKLARPKVKIVWKMPGEDIDGKAVEGAHVKLKEIALTDSNREGIAELPGPARGLREATYEVHLTFDAEGIEIIDGRLIKVSPAVTEPEIFHVRKCWIEFVVLDQFDRPFEGEADFVLTFPDDKKTEKGTLGAAAKGKVKRDGPSGQYKFELKLLYAARWTNSAAKIGEETALSVQAAGYEASEITFEIYDGSSPTGSPLDTVTASKVEGTTAEATWTPDAGKLATVKSGTVRFIAKAGKSKAVSAALPIYEQRSFKVTGPDDGALETNLILHLSDGEDVQTRSTGGEAKPWLPLGKRVVGIALPGVNDRVVSFQVPDGPGALGTYLPKPI